MKLSAFKALLTCAVALACSSVSAQSHDTIPLPGEPMSSITVLSLRAPLLRDRVPGVVTVVTPRDIAASSATSLSEIVKTFTAAESADVQGLSSAVELRGFGVSAFLFTDYTAMLLDGVRMGTRRAGMTMTSGIASVEILKGPFSALYGSGAMGGIVNVNTVQSRGDVGGSARISYGSYRTFGAGAAAGGSLGGKVDFDLSIDHLRRTDDYRTGKHTLLNYTPYELAVLDPRSRDTIYRNTAFDKTQGTLRLGIDLLSGWRLNLHNGLYYTGKAASNGSLWGINGEIDARLARNYHRADLTGRRGRHSLRLSPFVSFERARMKDITGFATGERDEDYNTWGVLAQDAVELGFGTLAGGIDNLSERYNSARRTTGGDPLSPFQPDYLNSQTGLFAQLSFTLPGGRLSGIAGARYDRILLKTYRTAHITEGAGAGSRRYNAFNPNFSVRYRLLARKSLSLHAGVGRAFLAPNAFKLMGKYGYDFDGSGAYVTRYAGNPDLKPESSVTWEAGVEYSSPSRTLEADMTLFVQDHKNIVGTQNEGDYMTYVNADGALFRGLELTASFDLGAALEKDYTWRFFGSAMRIFHGEVRSGDLRAERKYLSRTKMTFGSEFVRGRVTLSAQGRYVGGKLEDDNISYATGRVVPARPDGLILTPDYAVIDFSAACRLPGELTLRLKVANLLDELYMERDGYHMPGRNFTLGAEYRF